MHIVCYASTTTYHANPKSPVTRHSVASLLVCARPAWVGITWRWLFKERPLSEKLCASTAGSCTIQCVTADPVSIQLHAALAARPAFVCLSKLADRFCQAHVGKAFATVTPLV